jgi:hypothetical protein
MASAAERRLSSQDDIDELFRATSGCERTKRNGGTEAPPVVVVGLARLLSVVKRKQTRQAGGAAEPRVHVERAAVGACNAAGAKKRHPPRRRRDKRGSLTSLAGRTSRAIVAMVLCSARRPVMMRLITQENISPTSTSGAREASICLLPRREIGLMRRRCAMVSSRSMGGIRNGYLDVRRQPLTAESYYQ